MFTLGYRFRPWTEEKAIADGPSILRYVRETAQAYGVDRAHPLRPQGDRAASWSTAATATWTVEAETGATGRRRSPAGSCWSCSGYYDYDGGYQPEFPGVEDFAGRARAPAGTGPRTSTTPASGSW